LRARARPPQALSRAFALAMPCAAALRNAGRRAAGRCLPNAGELRAARNLCGAAAPYKVYHLQNSGKFPEPLLNTPTSVTVLSKEVLRTRTRPAKQADAFRPPVVTLGTGGGRQRLRRPLLHRVFDARNGTSSSTGSRLFRRSAARELSSPSRRDPARPASSFAGPRHCRRRDQLCDQQATTIKASQHGQHVSAPPYHAGTLDITVDQPTLCGARRRPSSGRQCRGPNYVTDAAMAAGGWIASTWKPVDAVNAPGNYIHTD